jgi:hypothetical protein
MLLEPAAARMAPSEPTPEDLRESREAYEEMQATTGDLLSSVEADLRFHMAVLEATHNAFCDHSERKSRCDTDIQTVCKCLLVRGRRSDQPHEAFVLARFLQSAALPPP